MTIETVRESARSGNLVVVLGAGASIALTPKIRPPLSWVGLVKSGLSYATQRGHVNESQNRRYIEALESADIDDLLGVAEFVGRKLGAPNGDTYSRWMSSVFSQQVPEAGGMQNALRAIHSHKVPIATLNYDTLAEKATGLQSIDFVDTKGLLEWSRGEKEGVLHLHGVWTDPKNCVFGIRDYQNTVDDEIRAVIQPALGSLKRLLFVGCGDTFADPNFSALVKWLRTNLGASAPQHYALVQQSEVASRLVDPSWHGFVEPLSHGETHADLPGFLLDCFPTKAARRTTIARRATNIEFERIISAYRAFLIRDCGEMTIEGMRADLDTAQRKFNIERLFVPLDLQEFPPASLASDPRRKEELTEWHASHGAPKSFSEVFEKNLKMALLALPGGGKTMLLKRLAVAYANPARRQDSADKLPILDLIPLVIRCREWKEHIRKPISSLIKNISTITGDSSLDGLAGAIEKPLKAGTVILLVDGLDEIHDDGDRSVFVENLEKFLEIYPKIRLLVTSREAGFDLIAPCLNRFCVKFRIAPLNREAVTLLCDSWHKLMGGGALESIAEARMVASTLLGTDSLRRLAENPLLCTMLLVVKHGFGRLPPDRVTLYDRAVEILLDTWNIKGHDALNTKEAVPQLACVAYELLRLGKQTATEREILKILEEARAWLPMIGRYAKDSPHDFLKRVELRSSLMIEGGYTTEEGRVVPFYQFRHLTFQEYLAAVAAVDGHIVSQPHSVNVLDFLRSNLVSEEWKEVIPMAAVLARSQAAPLLTALVEEAEREYKVFSPGARGRQASVSLDGGLPPATARIVRAMVEEANFPADLLMRSAPIVAWFAHGCEFNENWQSLSRGPYGPEIRSAALRLYMSHPLFEETNVRRTLCYLEASSHPASDWADDHLIASSIQIIRNGDEEDVVRAISAVAGSFQLIHRSSAAARSDECYHEIERRLFDKNIKIRLIAIWAWGYWRHLQPDIGRHKPLPSPETIELLSRRFLSLDEDWEDFGDLGVADLIGVPRGSCDLNLSESEIARFKNLIDDYRKDSRSNNVTLNRLSALSRVAFIAKDLMYDYEVRELFTIRKLPLYHNGEFDDMLAALGLPLQESRRKPRRRNTAVTAN
ncbi:SIR2 family protein [Ancylobacter sp. FA202]|uniref:SIR2 family protein n=1 Tax=Ancylobacter sp. FA202 TaxID=1111106 RepID=UPI0012DE7F7C|nr:SIR2 family protein [Ancylobacter sp. FA202]